MADLSSEEKLNLALKMVFGIQGLTNTSDSLGKKWYEEPNSWVPFLLNKDLYMQNVPPAVNATAANANVAANPTLIERRDIKLSIVAGTNNRAWAAYKTYNDPTSGIYDDWLLPQIFGQGYVMQLFQDNGSGTGPGAEITTTQGAWVPSYKLGFIVLAAGFTATDVGWTQPLWARVYRYIGAKGISGSTANVSLDDAYNTGRVISADAGPVVINASGGYAHLQLSPLASVPTVGINAGQICNVNGIAYIYDGSRSKWLSINRTTASFHANRGDANYLNFGEFSDNAAGYVVPRDCTLVAISGSVGRGNMSKGFAIQKNGTETNLLYFNLSSGKYFASDYDVSIPGTPINLDLTKGDILQVYCDAVGGSTTSARVNLELAWKL